MPSRNVLRHPKEKTKVNNDKYVNKIMANNLIFPAVQLPNKKELRQQGLLTEFLSDAKSVA